MEIKFPLLILGYSPDRVFSTEDADGHVHLPVFFDPEKAEAYRKFFIKEHFQVLEPYVIASAQQAWSFFHLLLSTDPNLGEVAIDPSPPVDGNQRGQQLPFAQFLRSLGRQVRPSGPRRRKAGNHRRTRTSRG